MSDLFTAQSAIVARLTALEAGRSAPSAGARFPDLQLPDHHGQYQSLQALQDNRPMIVSFVRGGWCPYCRGELEQWREQMPALAAAGVAPAAAPPVAEPSSSPANIPAVMQIPAADG